MVNFNILNGQIFSTSEYRPSNGNSKSVTPSYANSATYCTVTWTPGPCEPIDLGIVCYDTFTTTCYSTDPPLLLGFPLWNGSGGGSGTGNGGDPGDQYLCDLDPNCIPHPGTDINPEELISMEGYWAEFENFQIESNPGVKNWQSHTETQRFFHLISHLKRARMLGLNTIDVRAIFSNWPENIEAGGHIKGYWANVNYNGVSTKVYYEIPVSGIWTVVSVYGSRSTNYYDECVIEYYRPDGNLRSILFVLRNNNLCEYFTNELL